MGREHIYHKYDHTSQQELGLEANTKQVKLIVFRDKVFCSALLSSSHEAKLCLFKSDGGVTNSALV